MLLALASEGCLYTAKKSDLSLKNVSGWVKQVMRKHFMHCALITNSLGHVSEHI